MSVGNGDNACMLNNNCHPQVLLGGNNQMMKTYPGSLNGLVAMRHQKKHANFTNVHANQNARDVNARLHP